MRVYLVHAFTTFVRATACLGALARGVPEPARLRALIQHARRGLDATDGTRPQAQLFDAEPAVLRGDLDAAVAGYRLAATGFDGLDVMLAAEAARWRLGELLGGDEGGALVRQATAVLSAEGIVRPDRVVAMLAPVPADARRTGDR